MTWRGVALALACGVLAVALGGCFLFNDNLPEPVSGAAALAALDGAQTHFDDAKAEGKDDAQALATVVAWLLSCPEVSSAAVSSDPTIVEFAFRDGTPGLFFGGEAWTESASEGTASVTRQMVLSMASRQPGRKTGLVLSPFPRFFDRTPDRVKTMLQDFGWPVTYLKGEEVTLEALRSIHEYGVVMICTHGGAASGQVVLLSGEKATAASWETYVAWRTAGKIGYAGHSGQFWPWDDREWWYVTPAFFEDVPASEGSLFYAHACHSLDGETMANALIESGVAVYAGWTGTVFAGLDSSVPRRFFEALCGGETVAEADAVDGSGAATYRGDGSFVLEANGYTLIDKILFCIEQGGFDYCSRIDWGYSSQWLQNGATNDILLADARREGTLEPIGSVDFDRIEIRLRTWACYPDAWAKLTTDNVRLIINSTAQVVPLDDMEGEVLARWAKTEHSTGGMVRGGNTLAVVSPDDHSQALQVYVPTGIDASCAGVWAVRAFDMPLTVNTSDVTLRLFPLAEGQGYYHEGFIEIFLYRES